MKNKKFQQRNRGHKEEPNGKIRTETFSSLLNENSQRMGPIAEWIRQRQQYSELEDKIGIT